jgi:hypothetical protein
MLNTKCFITARNESEHRQGSSSCSEVLERFRVSQRNSRTADYEPQLLVYRERRKRKKSVDKTFACKFLRLFSLFLDADRNQLLCMHK